LPATSTLTLGDQTDGNLTLVADTGTTFTATGTVGVTLSGAGSGAVIVETGSVFTPAANTRIDLGNGAIALSGVNSQFVGTNAVIRGFTYHKGPSDSYLPQTTGIYDPNTYRGTLLGKKYTDGLVTIAGGAYTVDYDGTSGVFNYGQLAGTGFTGTGAGGALITKASDIAE
jgi:hypothetical protein